jgi:hypothetical protein
MRNSKKPWKSLSNFRNIVQEKKFNGPPIVFQKKNWLWLSLKFNAEIVFNLFLETIIEWKRVIINQVWEKIKNPTKFSFYVAKKAKQISEIHLNQREDLEKSNLVNLKLTRNYYILQHRLINWLIVEKYFAVYIWIRM